MVGTFSNRAVIVLSLVVALVAGGVGALASDQFSDVPTSHPFHEEIGAIADAGISTGYGDGTFRPDRDVSRGAMAAFLERSGGRVGETSGLATLNSSGTPEAQVASLHVEAGAAGEGDGFVLVSGTARFNTGDEQNCPCKIMAHLHRAGKGSAAIAVTTLGSIPDESGLVYDSMSLEHVFPVPADSVREFELRVELADDDVGDVHARGDMTAIYVPFGPDGDSTLDFEFESPR